MIRSSACDPANPWLSVPVRIARIIPETPGVATYEMEFVDHELAAGYVFRPGQFNMLYLPGVGEIAISASGDPCHGSRLPHTVRVAGNVTQTLAEQRVGAVLGLRGPFGSCWPLQSCAGRDVVLVAGGIGLAPLRPVIYELLAERDNFGQVTLLCGARTPEGLLYRDEYQSWRTGGLDVQTTVDRSTGDWSGNVGVVTVLLERLELPRPTDAILLTCGPEVMMWYTIQAALGRGLAPGSVYLSLERNMNCAIGLCGHCQFGPEFVCMQGPVFPYERVTALLKVDEL